MRKLIPIILYAVVPVAAAIAIIGALGTGADPVNAGGGMDAMSVDTDPTGNTATALGAQDECFETTAGATVEVDVTATNIPAGNAMAAFSISLLINPSFLSVTAFDNNFLLAANAGAQLFNITETLPDPDDPDKVILINRSIDFSAGADPPLPGEFGSGVLSRITLVVDSGTPSGSYALILKDTSIHIDDNNDVLVPVALNHGRLAVGLSCTATPPATPTPPPIPVTPPPIAPPTPGTDTPTPTPGTDTPTPTPGTDTATPTPTAGPDTPTPTPTAGPDTPTPTPTAGPDTPTPTPTAGPDTPTPTSTPGALPDSGARSGSGGSPLIALAGVALLAAAAGAFALSRRLRREP